MWDAVIKTNMTRIKILLRPAQFKQEEHEKTRKMKTIIQKEKTRDPRKT